MKNIQRRLLAVMVALLLFALPSQALAASNERILGDKFIFGGSYTLLKGDEINGNLFIFGGEASLDIGSTITGDVLLFGGDITANGDIGGDILAFGGKVNMLNHSDITGDAVMLGSRLTRTNGARIGGQVLSETSLKTITGIPNTLAPRVPVVREIGPWLAWNWLWFLFQMILWALFGLFCAMFFIGPLERTATTILSQPAISWGVGILTLIVTPVLLLFLAVTILLIPAALVGLLALVVGCILGWTAIGFEVGRNMNRQFNQQWTPVVATSIGTFTLSVLVFGAGKIIPCIGWLIPFVIVFPIGLGAVLLTRFGTQVYPPPASTALDIPIPGQLSETNLPEAEKNLLQNRLQHRNR